MKLLVQSDDYGLTRGITDGIIYGIENGIIRNTGLMTNMTSSYYAASQIKRYSHVCFGIDINLVSGYPVTDPKLIPSLVDGSGQFIRSTKRQGWTQDPFDLEQTVTEMENQVKKYIELVGKMPEYIHPHAINTPNIELAHDIVSKKYSIRRTANMLKENNVTRVDGRYNTKPFPIEKQMETDVTEKFKSVLDSYLKKPIIIIGGHAGFIDDEIFQLSTYSLIRIKDLSFFVSDYIKNWIVENDVEMITYRDFK